jgi:hypothetical protein
MATEMATVWSQCKFSCISFALCLTEIITVWGAVAVISMPGRHDAHLIAQVTTDAWLLGGLCSLVFAVAGLLFDRDRMIALIALATTVVAFFVCGLPMSV